MKNGLTRKFLLIAILLVLLTSTNVFAYAFFNDFTREDQVSINLGEWLNNSISISTPQEFYDCVTNENSLSTDYYYLNNDIDFTDFTWDYNSSVSSVIFRGTIVGNNHTINNLTITTTDKTLSYFGIFPRIDGATISNINFNNINLTLDNYTISNSNMRTGLLVGRVSAGENTISNINITNSTVIGTSLYGASGLIGQVYGKSSIVNIDSIKTTNLKVFSTKSYVAGIVGYVYGNQSTVNISNIDIQAEIFSTRTSAYSGGIIGKARSGSTVNISNSMIDITIKNTFVDYYDYFNKYSKRYLGGVIGYNQTSNLTIENVFITGELVTSSSSYYKYVGTLIGRNSTSYIVNNTYYSNILFRQSNGSVNSTTPTSYRGVMADFIQTNEIWWNSFYENFNKSIWSQNDSGYLTLTT